MIDINKINSHKNELILKTEKHVNKIGHFVSKSVKLYLGSASSNLPGVSNLYYAPQEFLDAAETMYHAYSLGDREGLYENAIRITQAFLSYVHALIQTTWNILYIGTFLNFALKSKVSSLLAAGSAFSKQLSAFGLTICAIEAIQEAVGLTRSIKFLNENNPLQIEELKKSSPGKEKELETAFYLEKLSKIQQKHLTISPEDQAEIDLHIQNTASDQSSSEQKKLRDSLIEAKLDRKKNALIRRVRPKLANELEQSIPELLKNLSSTNEATRDKASEKAAIIFKRIVTQCHKQQLVHCTGLLSVAFTVIGLILGCFVLPLGIALTFLFIGMALSGVRYCLHHGFLDSKGWKFSVSRCIPDPIKDLYKALFPPPVPNTPEVLHPIRFELLLPGAARYNRVPLRLDYTFYPSKV
jgi:hypothetical protein